MSETAVQADKAGKRLWDSLWDVRPLPRAIDPYSAKVGRFLERKHHALYRSLFGETLQTGKRLLEIGCAGSAWLPYFAREFGFEVSGIDYSEVGCLQAQAVLAREGVSGTIVCCDAFNPPAGLHDRFDVVVSYGVVEHFADTAGCLAAFARFLKPGGIMIAEIPNLSGSLGLALRLLERDFYDAHVVMTVTDFEAAHRRAGLRVVQDGYFAPVNYGVLFTGVDYGLTLGGRFRDLTRRALVRSTFLTWYAIDHWHLPFPETRLFSPYIVTISTRHP